VFGQNKDCRKITDKISGGNIDLGPLIGREVTWGETFSTFKGTLCKDTYVDCGICGGPAGICQYTTPWTDCVGKFYSAEGLAGVEGVDLFYDSGDFGYTGHIRIECDPNIELSTPTYDTSPTQIKLRSKYACVSSPPVTNCKKILDSAGSGTWYDLSPIIGQQLFWKDAISNLKVGICVSNYSDCGTCDGPAGMCQYTNTWSDCVGQYTMAVGLPDSKGVELFYDDGDFGNAGRVRIICDPNIAMGTPTYENSPYFITVRSKYACLCNFVCVPPY